MNHELVAVREFFKQAAANGAVDAGVLAVLYDVTDDRSLPGELEAARATHRELMQQANRPGQAPRAERSRPARGPSGPHHAKEEQP